MNKLLLNTNFIKRVKNTFFAFYKSKEIKKIFDILEKDQPKDKKIVLNSMKLKWNLAVEEFKTLTKKLNFN